MTHVMRGKLLHETMERMFRDLLDLDNIPSVFPIKEAKIQKAKLEILAEYGIENITDDIDAESEYKAAVAEIMSEKPELILGGTGGDFDIDKHWFYKHRKDDYYKNMFERPQHNAFENR